MKYRFWFWFNCVVIIGSLCSPSYVENSDKIPSHVDVLGGAKVSDMETALDYVKSHEHYRNYIEQHRPINELSCDRKLKNQILGDSIELLYLGKYGMVTTTKDTTIIDITLTGIHSIKDMITKGANVFLARDDDGLFGGGYVHRGFNKVYKTMWTAMYKVLKAHAEGQNKQLSEYRYRVYGFSMGGALATMTAMRIARTIFHFDKSKIHNLVLDDEIRVITFGMPRSFSGQAANYYNTVLGPHTARVFFSEDLAVDLSPSYFKHVGEAFSLNFKICPGKKTSCWDAHNSYNRLFLHEPTEIIKQLRTTLLSRKNAGGGFVVRLDR